METHLFSYNHDGKRWSFEIAADSREDAEARVKRLSLATYDGVLVAKIPAAVGGGLIARLCCAIRNFISDRGSRG